MRRRQIIALLKREGQTTTDSKITELAIEKYVIFEFRSKTVTKSVELFTWKTRKL